MMSMNKIGHSGQNSTKISDQLQQVILNSIRNVLPDIMIAQTCREIGYRFRRRKITPAVTVLHMVMAALWPEESFNACWQVLWDTFISGFPQLCGQCPSRGRVAEARARLPLRLWRRLFEQLSGKAQRLSETYDKWKGHRVVLADGHADRRKWMDKRTLEFIRQNAEDPSSHSGITLASPDNADIQWLVKHFVAQNRVE